MSIWIMLIIIIGLSMISFVFFLIIFLKYIKRKKISKIKKDIKNSFLNFKLQKVNKKDLSVDVENIKENIYFSDKVINGKYKNNNKIRGKKINLDIQDLLKEKYEKQIFLRYKLREVNFLKSSDFIPLNQIDLIISKEIVYFIDPFEPYNIPIKKIKNITLFWEKNNYLTIKKKFIGISFIYENITFFILFNEYKSAISFITHIFELSRNTLK